MKSGFLVIDKPQDWTSHDVVAKMRGVLGIKKIGHLGTLDPLATGVLVLAVGRDATKRVQELMGADKEYEVEMEFGKQSDSYDSKGQIEIVSEDVNLTFEEIDEVLKAFWGKTMQVPPAFSAKKIGGKRAYKLARAGIKVKLAAREVEMQGSELSVELPFARFHLHVSSGTYVRSLAHDVGQKLGVGGIMTNLRRTRVGQFSLAQAKLIENVKADVELIPADVV